MRKISTQLVVSFLIIALLPTLPLSLVVRDLLERRFGPSMAEPLEQAMESGLAESRAHLRELRNIFGIHAAGYFSGNRPEKAFLLDFNGNSQPADSLELFLSERPALMEGTSGLAVFEPGSQIRGQRLDDALVARIKTTEGDTTVLFQPLPSGMVDRAGDLTSALTLLRVLRGQDSRVLQSFVGPFLLVYGLLILVALGVGMIWSRQMIKPLEVLVDATRQVAEGNLEFRIKRQGPGEVGDLVKSFDQMVGNLAHQRRDLVRLERAAAWRGMARTLAHEVKNPLTPILLAVNQARDCYSGDDQKYQSLLDEVAEIVGEEVESLRRLVREFGDFARLPKPILKPDNLHEMLAELAQLYGSEKLKVESSSSQVEDWFDHDALRRGLINLIDNGLSACHEAGRPQAVQLTSTRCESGVELVVQDLGTGIAENHLEKIFEPDFTTKSGGMGLGLAIVENIVLGHGGTISVESEMGIGTRFIIRLPLTAAISSGVSSGNGKT